MYLYSDRLLVADGYGESVLCEEVECAGRTVRFTKGDISLDVEISTDQWIMLRSDSINSDFEKKDKAKKIFEGVLVNQNFVWHDIPRFILSIGVTDYKGANSFCIFNTGDNGTMFKLLRAPRG